ncbi:esterase-like activity of phytase family protein [Pseudoroseicyclus tamaricis]|uniref:Esterase-like activity of phytase family protein n=1 Tax=Pseudoroseicyclus tamaricis TaxID=2705421 RepID=A0A6B2JR63_9RHOB|nr:esterase-like activity of phytase family protein [Pseudoroseicyclus tamaricis]NDV01047.1 esterase-like activity of phytase family protein [Pseudoroseicyclus tamaricis]
MTSRLALCLPATLALLAAPAAAQDLPQPEFYGQITLPSGLSMGGVTFGGISDLTVNPETGHILAISDDRIENGPARFYELALEAAEGILTLDIVATHELSDETGAAFGEKGADPEGIAFDDVSGRLFWSSERDAEGVPAIYVAAADGTGTEKVTLPDGYLPGEVTGIYGNLGFEGLTLSPDGQWLIAATESALQQDGPIATLEAGTLSRILMIDAATLEPAEEYLYPVEAIYEPPTGEESWNDNGVSAIAFGPDNQLFVVERSFASGAGNHIRVYLADIEGATDVAAGGIEGATPVSKSLWFEIGEGDFGGLDIDNIESLTFLPEIDGEPAFLIASDDNFNPATQFSQFVVFTIPR